MADDDRDRRVALLRGINVGTANRVKMADLRAVVEDLGYEEVRTWGASGNVVFTVPPEGIHSSRLAKAVERAVDGAVTSRNWKTTTRLAELLDD